MSARRIAILSLLCSVSLSASLSQPPGAVAIGTAAPRATLPGVTYTEPYRPRYHFSPARNWLNDPNGLIYVDGEYHLFFQYNPQGDKWGHMSWGHAVSSDLLHWRELPVAIPEDEQGMIFSGSVVLDAGNTSGFGRNGEPPWVAIYTSAGRGEGAAQRQHIAYSLDAGRTWTKYAGNPVLDIGSSAFRDPKVFRYEPRHEWLMAVSMADRHQVALYSSQDLKTWTHLSDFGPAGAADGPWECPDLFELPVDGNPAKTRWVLKVDVFRSAVAPGSGTQAFIGRFDGVRFTPDPDPTHPGQSAAPQAVDYGTDFYAALSWENLPSRRVWLAWMNSHHYAQEIPTGPWRGAMSLPRELILHAQDGAIRLRQAPVRELTALRGAAVRLGPTPLGEGPTRIAMPLGSGKALEILAVIEPGSAREAGLKVHVGPGEETLIGYDALTHLLFIDRARSGKIPAPLFAQRRAMPLQLHDGKIRLQVFVDASSVEVFANDGEGVMTEQVFASPRSGGVQAYALGGRARLKSMQAWVLRAAMRNAR